MSVYTYFFPKETKLGKGAFSEIKNIPNKGGICAVLCGRGGSLKKNGILKQALDYLALSGKKAFVFDAVEPEVSVETVDKAADFVNSVNADFVIGIGGGSVLDCAKAAAAVAPEGVSVKKFLDGENINKKPMPVCAVPTTAGTGSEVTRNAVLTYTEKKIKTSLRHNEMIPFFVILDPELTVSMPPYITAYTGMDALTHAVESYYSNRANDFTAMISLNAAKTIIEWLPKAVKNPNDIYAREKMLYASYEAGLAFSNAGLGAVHGIGHPVGSVCGIPHGVVNAVLLPAVLEFNINNSVSLRGGKNQAAELLDSIKKLARECGLPEKMSLAYNLYGEKISEIAELAVYTGSMAFNPVTMTPEKVIEILKKV